MKAFSELRTIAIFLGVAIFFTAGSAFGQIEIKRVPLSEEQAALTDGKALFDELCVSCHGMEGYGNGRAVIALSEAPANLTVLAAQNNGTFPRKEVKSAVSGRFKDDVHGELGMTSFYKVFLSAHPDWRMYRRQIYALQQIERLTDYLETIQVETEAS